ncbi:hypothetical protein [Pseudomonas chlororaphis]|uniref:hypothetical protein n=1 Tax=Pseudomonas chlororaphis TaxID=587753 RepID=UPI0012D315E0|nr:hypothetical protein [Pseudomonas chlororaphis]
MKINDLSPKPPKVSTSIGDLYVHYLSIGDVRRLSGLEKDESLDVIGSKALQLLVSRKFDRSSRDRLSDEDYAALNDADFEIILPMLYKQCDLSFSEALMSIGSFGAAVRVLLQEHVDRAKRISESFSSVLKPATLSQYRASLDGISNVTEKIRQSIVSRNAGNYMSSLEPAAVELKSPKPFDLSAIPENRAAKATEKSAESLEKMSGLLLEMAGSIGVTIDSLTRKVVPEYLSSLDESRASATRMLRITIAGLVFSALVSVALTGWQVYLANKSGEELGGQAKETLDTLKYQLEAAKSAQDRLEREFAIQRQQNEELNARLIAALKTMSAPVVNVGKPVSTAESKLNMKDGHARSGR